MNLPDFATAVLDRLTTMPPTVTLVDGFPKTTPAGNYASVQFDGGVGDRTHIARTDREHHTALIICVGLDTVGCRYVTRHVRDALTDWRPDGNHPLVEIMAGPQLSDGPVGDIRESVTLTFQLKSTRRNP